MRGIIILYHKDQKKKWEGNSTMTASYTPRMGSKSRKICYKTLWILQKAYISQGKSSTNQQQSELTNSQKRVSI